MSITRVSVPVTFTSQGRLVEHLGVIAAALVGERPILCHFPRLTLERLSRIPRQADSLELFREYRETLARAITAKLQTSGVSGELVHLLPHELLDADRVPIAA